MDWTVIIGLLLVLWGACRFRVAGAKPKNIWSTGKIQGFARLLGENGAAILFVVIGAAAAAGGILLML